MQAKMIVKLPQIFNEKNELQLAEKSSVLKKKPFFINKARIVSLTPDINNWERDREEKYRERRRKKVEFQSLDGISYKRVLKKKVRTERSLETSIEKRLPVLTIPSYYHCMNIKRFEPMTYKLHRAFESNTKVSLWDYYINRSLFKYQKLKY